MFHRSVGGDAQIFHNAFAKEELKAERGGLLKQGSKRPLFPRPGKGRLAGCRSLTVLYLFWGQSMATYEPRLLLLQLKAAVLQAPLLISRLRKADSSWVRARFIQTGFHISD